MQQRRRPTRPQSPGAAGCKWLLAPGCDVALPPPVQPSVAALRLLLPLMTAVKPRWPYEGAVRDLLASGPPHKSRRAGTRPSGANQPAAVCYSEWRWWPVPSTRHT